MSSTDFSLSKWYLDCLGEDGNTFIGYSTLLHWRPLTLHYTSVLNNDKKSGTYTETSLRENSLPRIDGSCIHWSSQSVDIEGTWQALSSPIQQELYRTSDGAINCVFLQPNAKVDVRSRKRDHLRGRGYVERIEITMKPWQLPIEELRWGRILSEKDTIVWIDWRGPAQQTFLFHNGVRTTDCCNDFRFGDMVRSRRGFPGIEQTICQTGLGWNATLTLDCE